MEDVAESGAVSDLHNSSHTHSGDDVVLLFGPVEVCLVVGVRIWVLLPRLWRSHRPTRLTVPRGHGGLYEPSRQQNLSASYNGEMSPDDGSMLAASRCEGCSALFLRSPPHLRVTAVEREVWASIKTSLASFSPSCFTIRELAHLDDICLAEAAWIASETPTSRWLHRPPT